MFHHLFSLTIFIRKLIFYPLLDVRIVSKSLKSFGSRNLKHEVFTKRQKRGKGINPTLLISLDLNPQEEGSPPDLDRRQPTTGGESS